MRMGRSVGVVLAGATAIAGCAGILGDFEVGTDGTDGGGGQDTGTGDTGDRGDATAPKDAASPGEGGVTDDGATKDAAPVCTADVCSCPPGTTLCSGACLALATDNAHCGTTCATAIACTAPTVCRAGACAPCTGTTKFCAGACVDYASDGANCGACGHSCGGGTCSGGACQPVQIGGALAGKIPSLVVTPGALFGTYNDSSGSGAVFRVALPGAPSTAAPPLVSKVTGPLGPLFFDGTSLWFGNTVTPASIYQAKLADLANPVRASYAQGSGTIYNLAALDGHPYWDQGTGTLYQQLGAPTATPVSVTPSTTRAIGGDMAAIYWAKAAGSIFAGHGDLTVAANNATIGQSPSSAAFTLVATDTKNVYFGDGNGLWRLPKSGAPAPTAYFTFSPAELPMRFAPDPDDARNRLYYISIDDTQAGSKTIFAIAKDGTSNVPVRVVSLTGAAILSALAVDTTAIYYATTAGEVWKLVK